MAELAREHLDESHFDVVICGAGLAGLTLALQLRRAYPEKQILLLEKTRRPLPEASHKVGESSVELGSAYFESLGLREYLREHHLIKFGLRFFPGGGELPLDQRLEIGPMQEPIVPSYQIDRGRFENDLRARVEQQGVKFVEGAQVRAVTLAPGEDSHWVSFRLDAAEAQGEHDLRVSCRWVVDATGRNALLRRKLKLTRRNRHSASAGWFRVRGRLDITQFVPSSNHTWHQAAGADQRWRSTNHLMGSGYWAWLIPLASGQTSVGLVVHEEEHSFDRVRTLERTLAFLKEHEPCLARQLEHAEVMDFLCLRDYSHTVGRSWSPDRWAIVGEAGAFVDPLYSPGSDFIAYANTFTTELMRLDDAGLELESRVRDFNLQYRALVSGNVDIFREAAPVYGHPRAMLAKTYWDNFSYWSYPCQFFLQHIYRLESAATQPFVDVGLRFVELSSYVQQLMRQWALLAPEAPEAGFLAMPRFPSVVVDAHLALQDKMTPEQTLAYMEQRSREGAEIVGELLIRVLGELAPERAVELVERLQLSGWSLSISGDRLAAEPSIGLARRRLLSPIARDVERSLGRPRKRASEAELRDWLAPFVTDAATDPAATARAELSAAATGSGSSELTAARPREA